IEAPFGQVTTLDYDAHGYLSEISPDPEHDPYLFEYSVDGLMTEQTDPRGGVHIYGYDDLGRVDYDEDPTGAAFTFEAESSNGVHTVTRTSELGRETVYEWRFVRDTNNDEVDDARSRYTVTFPTGHSNVVEIDSGGVSTTTFVDGTRTTLTPNA